MFAKFMVFRENFRKGLAKINSFSDIFVNIHPFAHDFRILAKIEKYIFVSILSYIGITKHRRLVEK
jgi:hypothetical protein